MTTDTDLLRAWFRRRDDTAFTTLVERHRSLVLAACRRCLAEEPAEVDDAVQAVFGLLAVKAGALIGGARHGGTLAGWLWVTARGVCANRRRAAQRRRHHEAQVEPPPATEPVDERLLAARALLPDAIATLTPARRDVVLRHCLAGRPQRDVAAELGISVDAVKQRLREALTQLRGVLRRRGLAVEASVLAAVFAMPAEAAEEWCALMPAPVAIVGAGALATGASALVAGGLACAVWLPHASSAPADPPPDPPVIAPATTTGGALWATVEWDQRLPTLLAQTALARIATEMPARRDDASDQHAGSTTWMQRWLGDTMLGGTRGRLTGSIAHGRSPLFGAQAGVALRLDGPSIDRWHQRWAEIGALPATRDGFLRLPSPGAGVRLHGVSERLAIANDDAATWVPDMAALPQSPAPLSIRIDARPTWAELQELVALESPRVLDALLNPWASDRAWLRWEPRAALDWSEPNGSTLRIDGLPGLTLPALPWDATALRSALNADAVVLASLDPRTAAALLPGLHAEDLDGRLALIVRNEPTGLRWALAMIAAPTNPHRLAMNAAMISDWNDSPLSGLLHRPAGASVFYDDHRMVWVCGDPGLANGLTQAPRRAATASAQLVAIDVDLRACAPLIATLLAQLDQPTAADLLARHLGDYQITIRRDGDALVCIEHGFPLVPTLLVTALPTLAYAVEEIHGDGLLQARFRKQHREAIAVLRRLQTAWQAAQDDLEPIRRPSQLIARAGLTDAELKPLGVDQASIDHLGEFREEVLSIQTIGDLTHITISGRGWSIPLGLNDGAIITPSSSGWLPDGWERHRRLEPDGGGHYSNGTGMPHLKWQQHQRKNADGF